MTCTRSCGVLVFDQQLDAAGVERAEEQPGRDDARRTGEAEQRDGDRVEADAGVDRLVQRWCSRPGSASRRPGRQRPPAISMTTR